MNEESGRGMEWMFPRYLLEDRNGYALARAICAGLEMMREALETGVATVLDVGRMPEWRLDEMAWELNAQWYDYGADVETKRAQISGAKRFYRQLGTPRAVEQAIGAVFGTGRVEEWFTYGGEPYTFRVYTTDASALKEKRREFLRLLELVKNVRSRLDNIYYYGSSAKAGAVVGAKATGVHVAAYAVAKNYGRLKDV